MLIINGTFAHHSDQIEKMRSRAGFQMVHLSPFL